MSSSIAVSSSTTSSSSSSSRRGGASRRRLDDEVRARLAPAWLAAHDSRRPDRSVVLAVDLCRIAELVARAAPLPLRARAILLAGTVRLHVRRTAYLERDCAAARGLVRSATRARESEDETGPEEPPDDECATAWRAVEPVSLSRWWGEENREWEEEDWTTTLVVDNDDATLRRPDESSPRERQRSAVRRREEAWDVFDPATALTKGDDDDHEENSDRSIEFANDLVGDHDICDHGDHDDDFLGGGTDRNIVGFSAEENDHAPRTDPSQPKNAVTFFSSSSLTPDLESLPCDDVPSPTDEATRSPSQRVNPIASPSPVDPSTMNNASVLPLPSLPFVTPPARRRRGGGATIDHERPPRRPGVVTPSPPPPPLRRSPRRRRSFLLSTDTTTTTLAHDVSSYQHACARRPSRPRKRRRPSPRRRALVEPDKTEEEEVVEPNNGAPTLPPPPTTVVGEGEDTSPTNDDDERERRTVAHVAVGDATVGDGGTNCVEGTASTASDDAVDALRTDDDRAATTTWGPWIDDDDDDDGRDALAMVDEYDDYNDRCDATVNPAAAEARWDFCSSPLRLVDDDDDDDDDEEDPSLPPKRAARVLAALRQRDREAAGAPATLSSFLRCGDVGPGARRAASALFHELLRLRTWDYVTLEQRRSYGEILVTRGRRFDEALSEKGTASSTPSDRLRRATHDDEAKDPSA